MFDYSEWLKSLKVGDKVCHPLGFSDYCITTIIHITPTRRITTENGWKFNEYGRSKSQGVHGSLSIEPITDKVMNIINRHKYLSFLKHDIPWDEMSTKQLCIAYKNIHKMIDKKGKHEKQD